MLEFLHTQALLGVSMWDYVKFLHTQVPPGTQGLAVFGLGTQCELLAGQLLAPNYKMKMMYKLKWKIKKNTNKKVYYLENTKTKSNLTKSQEKNYCNFKIRELGAQ